MRAKRSERGDTIGTTGRFEIELVGPGGEHRVCAAEVFGREFVPLRGMCLLTDIGDLPLASVRKISAV